MKNIISAAVVAAMALSLASCDPAKKSGPASTTTEIDTTTTTKTTSFTDSGKTDSGKVMAQVSPDKDKAGDAGSTSARAVRDSFKKDSVRLSKK